MARIGQRVRITSPYLISKGWTFADITAILDGGNVKANLIHPSSTTREEVMLAVGDYAAVPGRPRFPHIDGKAPNFGAGRKGMRKDKGPEAPDAGVAGDEKGDGKGDNEGEGEEAGDDAPYEWDHAEEGDFDEDDEDEIADEDKAPVAEHPLITELKSLITDAIGNSLDIVDDKIAAALKDVPRGTPEGKPVIIKLKDIPEVKLSSTPHALLERVLKLYTAQVSKRNVMLVGPAGSGKTTLGEQLAEVLRTTFAAISCSPGMSETKVLGRVTPRITGDEASIYEPTPIVEAYVGGGVILFDELDNSDASILTAFNSMLANGYVMLPNGARAERHPNTLIIGTANTYGHGADRIYVGRNALDGATLDRFTGTTLDMDYDRNVESSLCPEQEIRDFVWAVRDKVRHAKLRRIVSTRFLMSVRSLYLSGIEKSIKAAAKACATGWTDADLRTAGIA